MQKTGCVKNRLRRGQICRRGCVEAKLGRE